MLDTITYIHGTIPLAFYSPLLTPLCLLFVSPFTYLAPSSCDRNRPPRSQVACKLTPFAPPYTQPTPPLQIPRTPTAQRLTKTTSGIFWLLLSGTETTGMLLNKLTATHQLLIKNVNFFLPYIAEQFYVNDKAPPEEKVKNDPADTSLKGDLSIDTIFDSCLSS
jgi:hypothetical protein